MKKYFVLGAVLFSFCTWAQDSRESDDQILRQSGKLFTVTLSPKGKTVQISLAAMPGVKVNWDDNDVRVFTATKFSLQPLAISKVGSNTFVSQQFPIETASRLEVHAGSNKEKEVFKFNLR